MLEHVLAAPLGWPHHQVATDGSFSSSPSRSRHSPGRNGMMAAVSITPEPSALAIVTLPARAASTSPATPSDESPRSSSGSQKLSSSLPEDDVDRLQAFERLDEDAAVAHRQVAAFDQREAQIAREVRMLEVRFVVRPGRQQHDPGLVVRLRRQRHQRVALSAEERRQPLNLAVAERFGQAAQQHDPVLERVAGARRRLRPVGEHPPLAVRRARQVDGVQVQVDIPAGRGMP